MTDEQQAMVKTARSAGAVGRDPIVYRHFLHVMDVPTTCSVLDFGSGPQAVHAQRLSEAGYDVTAYDLGMDDYVDLSGRTFDVVLCSNVLNVQPTREAVEGVLAELRSFCHPSSIVLMNYPASPRKAGLPVMFIERLILDQFHSYTTIHMYSAPLYICEVRA